MLPGLPPVAQAVAPRPAGVHLGLVAAASIPQDNAEQAQHQHHHEQHHPEAHHREPDGEQRTTGVEQQHTT